MNELNIDWLRANGKNIRLHGNRFIQIDLSDIERIHVWGDRVPFAQRVPTWIHDHTFSFESRVLSGTLVHVEYRVIHDVAPYDHRTHFMYQTNLRKMQDTELQLCDPDGYIAVPKPALIAHQGAVYYFDHSLFHASTYIGHAVTRMKKRMRVEGLPRVLCPMHLSPDNAFDRYAYGEDDLWAAVAEIVALAPPPPA